MLIEIKIESKNGIAYAYDIEIEFIDEEKGNYFQPSIDSFWAINKVIKNGSDISKRLSTKIYRLIEETVDEKMANY